MNYGVMYEREGSSVFRLYTTWEEAYEEASSLGAGVYHAPVALYALDSIGGLFVKVVTF